MTEKIKDDVLDLTDLTTIIDDYCNKNNLDVKDALILSGSLLILWRDMISTMRYISRLVPLT